MVTVLWSKIVFTRFLGRECESAIFLEINSPFHQLITLNSHFMTRLPNGHLPFSNFLQLGSCLSQVWKWQQQPVQLNKVPELGHVIQTLPALSESGE